MNDRARSYDFRVIPLDLIDPPPLPMRDAMDDTKLAELTDSIARKGVQSPLGVYERDGRFVISYGHRRRVAAERAGETLLPCRVYADGGATEEDDKWTENYYREEVNPAEEATWFADLLERKHGGAIEALCADLHLRESFVNGRLDLLRGDPLVLEALRARKVNLAVARELNKVKEPDWRRHYLADAVDMGATADIVKGWRIARERTATLAAAAADPNAPTVAPSSEVPIESAETCILCLIPGDEHDMAYVRVHRTCWTVHRRHQHAGSQA